MKNPREVAMDYLSRREHTRQELAQKLLAKGFAAEDIEQTLDRLVQQDLQSDQRFVENYIHHRQLAGFGPRSIRVALQKKGVASVLIDEQLGQVTTDWRDIIQQVWQKKFTNKCTQGDPKEYARQVRFLLGRGFDMEMVRELLD